MIEENRKIALYSQVHHFFDRRERYKSSGIVWKRGIILYGTPGNGKTATLKCLMKSLYDRPDKIPSLFVKSLAPAYSKTRETSID